MTQINTKMKVRTRTLLFLLIAFLGTAEAASLCDSHKRHSRKSKSTSCNTPSLMPFVDISKNIPKAVGYPDLRIRSTDEQPTISEGAFRIVCTPSHMSNDDPLVFPNQQGAAHHHTFFGNTSLDYKSDLSAMSNVGNSTCNGGIMNRSAYWVPTMIDTVNGKPIAPDFTIFYYKVGAFSANSGDTIQPPPKGLRMLAGNSKATSETTATSRYTCLAPEGVTRPFFGWSASIPVCAVGDKLQMAIAFPQCWDGENLDSPDHKSHMAYPASPSAGAKNRCPQTHPVMIPEIGFNLDFNITTPNQTKKWRLSSDNYASSLPAGYSSHGDWINGWDEDIMAGIIKNCLQINGDCHAHLLGDGRLFY